jgi:PDZ domain-containing protein
VIPPDQSTYRLSRLWRFVAALTLVLIAALAAGSLIRLPFYSLQPGPARDVTKLVSIRGESTYPSRGALLLTTVAVSARPISLYEGLASVFDPATELVQRSVIVSPGLSDAQQDELNLVDMLQSKYAAAVVAMRALGRPVPRIPGARVVHVFKDSPSAGKLRDGDVITGIDGVSVIDVVALTTRIRAHKPGEQVTVAVQRADKVLTMRVGTRRGTDEEGKPRPVIGVSLAPAFRFPVDVQIDTQDIGGPSGGLVFALAIAEVLGRGDLTKGHVVAATGTIDLDGRVGEIGGIEQKVRAAERSGADVFLVPASEAAQAQKVARSLRVIGVRTLDEALLALEGLSARDAAA